jgi:RNA polymerase sigma factor (sigma-70 family)
MVKPPVVQLVKRALLRQALAEVSDAELLRRFTANRDGDAFAELVERYAGLVAGACRRALGTSHPAADDAFQTAFITLARKAGSVRPAQLPAWLFGVARKVAVRFRTMKVTPTAALSDGPSPGPSPAEQAGGKEWLAAVEDEVARLPEKYRAAVLLCWFDDSSLDDAARQLGTTKGTLWGWLKRAREKLRQRLTARGFGLPAVLGAALLAAPASAALIQRTVNAAVAASATAALPVALANVLPAAKPLGAAALVAASVVGLAVLLSAPGPALPAKDDPKAEVDPAPKAEAKPTDDGIPLPAGALHRFGNRQGRHPDGISLAVVSPDGKYLATVGQRTVIVWDAATLTAKQVFRDLRVPTRQGDDGQGRIAFLPDSKSLLISTGTIRGDVLRRGVAEGQVKDIAVVYDIETGQRKFAIPGQADGFSSAWVSASGKEIGVLGTRTARYFDAKDGKELKKIDLPFDVYNSSWLAPAADRALVRKFDSARSNAFLLDLRTGKELYEITGSELGQAALSADGKLLVAQATTGKVKVHDVEAKKVLCEFDHPADKQIGPMLVSADKKTLFLGGQHGQLYRWDLVNNKQLPDVGRHTTWTLTSFAPSPDESILYTVGWNKAVHRWDLKTGTQLPAPPGYVTQTAAVPLPDGKHLLVADHAGKIDLWDLASGRLVKELHPGNTFGIDCVAASADGRWLACGRTVQDVHLWDLKAGRLESTIPLAEKQDTGGGDHVKRVAFAPDGKTLLTGSGKTGISAWEVPDGKRLWSTRGLPGVGHLAAWDPKGRLVAAAGGSGNRQVHWTALDPKTGAVVQRYEVEPEVRSARVQTVLYPPYVTDLAFTPDAARLVTAHHDGTLRTWDPETGKELSRMQGNGINTYGIALSPDGKWAAVGSGEATYQVHVWELATATRVLTLSGHDSPVRDVAFTRDGSGLVANADLAPTLWSLAPAERPVVNAALWDVLASEDGAKSYPALWAFARDPKAAVKVFGESVKPADQAMDIARFEKLAAALDDPQFRLREVAEKELIRAAHRVPAAWLRQVLAGAKSEEQRERLGRVLVLREKPIPAERQLARAVQALELAGTPEAIVLLKSWSAAPEGSLLAVEAKAALARLGR